MKSIDLHFGQEIKLLVIFDLGQVSFQDCVTIMLKSGISGSLLMAKVSQKVSALAGWSPKKYLSTLTLRSFQPVAP